MRRTLASPGSCLAGENLPSAIVTAMGISSPSIGAGLDSSTIFISPSDSETNASPRVIPEVISTCSSTSSLADTIAVKLLRANKATTRIAIIFP